MNDERFVLGYKPPTPDGIWFNEREFHPLFKPTAAAEATPVQLQPPPPPETIEICRSFAYKLNLTKFGRDYESADFFCSRKMTCVKESAPVVSEAIFEECVEDIKSGIASFVADLQKKQSKRGAA